MGRLINIEIIIIIKVDPKGEKKKDFKSYLRSELFSNIYFKSILHLKNISTLMIFKSLLCHHRKNQSISSDACKVDTKL